MEERDIEREIEKKRDTAVGLCVYCVMIYLPHIRSNY